MRFSEALTLVLITLDLIGICNYSVWFVMSPIIIEVIIKIIICVLEKKIEENKNEYSKHS